MKRTSAALAVGAAVLLSPVLLAGPAFADDIIEEEPPGGATCAPEIPADDCEPETPATPKPTKPAKPAQPATIPVTGGTPSTSGSGSTSKPTLARTGSTETFVVGAAGAGLLLAGVGLVAAGRRRTA
jgi:LPXTG-motif cell wall-anchored protein